MEPYNFKQKEREFPEKFFGTSGPGKKIADKSHIDAMKHSKKHTVDDIFQKGRGYKQPRWWFTTESFHFHRQKGSGMANYDITIVDNVTLHILADSMKTALDIIEKEIFAGDSKLLQVCTDDINRLLQKKDLHEQHNLSWLPPFSQSEFAHHIPGSYPGTIHIESEDMGYIEYPSDITFIKVFVEKDKKIRVETVMGGNK